MLGDSRESSVIVSLTSIRRDEERRRREQQEAAWARADAERRVRAEEEKRRREEEERRAREVEERRLRAEEAARELARLEAARLQEAERRARAESELRLQEERRRLEVALAPRPRASAWVVGAASVVLCCGLGLLAWKVHIDGRAALIQAELERTELSVRHQRERTALLEQLHQTERQTHDALAQLRASSDAPRGGGVGTAPRPGAKGGKTPRTTTEGTTSSLGQATGRPSGRPQVADVPLGDVDLGDDFSSGGKKKGRVR